MVMGTVFLLTGLAFALFLVGAALLIWAVRAGQWDDLDTPAERMLGDDPPAFAPGTLPARTTPAHTISTGTTP